MRARPFVNTHYFPNSLQSNNTTGLRFSSNRTFSTLTTVSKYKTPSSINNNSIYPTSHFFLNLISKTQRSVNFDFNSIRFYATDQKKANTKKQNEPNKNQNSKHLQNKHNQGREEKVTAFSTRLYELGNKQGFQKARATFNQHIKEGHTPQEADYKVLILLAEKLPIALGLLSEMRTKYNLQPSLNIFTIIFDRFANSYNAFKLWDLLLGAGMNPDVPLYTNFIQVLGKGGKINSAFTIKNKMLEKGLPPSSRSFNMLLHLCQELGDTDRFFETWEDMKKLGVKMNYYLYTTVINALSKVGKDEEALELYDKMISDGFQPTKHTLMGVLHACRNLSNLKRAEQIYDQALKMNVQVDKGVFMMLLLCCKEAAEPEKALYYFYEAEKLKCEATKEVLYTLVDLLGHHRHPETQKFVYRLKRHNLPMPNIVRVL